MKSVATILLAFAISLVGFKAYSIENPTPGYYKAQKVVYHNDGGTPDNTAYSKRMLNSMKNHVEAMAAGKAKLEIRVVSHSGGVEMFQLANTDKDIAGRIDGNPGGQGQVGGSGRTSIAAGRETRCVRLARTMISVRAPGSAARGLGLRPGTPIVAGTIDANGNEGQTSFSASRISAP